MDKQKLAHTDLEVSRVCMGTMTFGSQADLDESMRIVDRSLDAGVNFFDTANIYNQGRSEEMIGRILGARRKDVVLASKVRGAMGKPTQYVGLSREAIRKGIEGSLRRLNTDYLDIYYLHQPDYDTTIEETLDAMEELRREGKIRYPATSNYSAWQLCEMHGICEKRGYEKPWIAQPMYNLAARGIEQEYLAFTEKVGISNVCYNPLGGGLLTGKHRKGQAPLPDTRFDGNQMYLKRYWHDPYFEAVAEFEQIAKEGGISMLQLALAWLLQQNQAHCIILGASKLDQLEQNLAALETVALSPEQLAACDQVWRKLRGPTPSYNR
jgi:aryl-alcohol dehydrogenase-like predicted oxidoreductase